MKTIFPRSTSTIARRGLLACLLAAAFVPGSEAHAQNACPEKPVHIIVGFPAGTGPDIVVRLFARKLSEVGADKA